MRNKNEKLIKITDKKRRLYIEQLKRNESGGQKKFSHCLRGEKVEREKRLRMFLRFYVTLKRTTSTFDVPLVFLNAATWAGGEYLVWQRHITEMENGSAEIVTSVGVILDISPK